MTENQELSWRQLCRHWWHGRLSLWQPMVPSETTKLASWRLSVSVYHFALILILNRWQCLRNYIGTSAFADVISYLMADVEAKYYVWKCTEHQPKYCYWQMLVNIVSQMLQVVAIKFCTWRDNCTVGVYKNWQQFENQEWNDYSKNEVSSKPNFEHNVSRET